MWIVDNSKHDQIFTVKLALRWKVAPASMKKEYSFDLRVWNCMTTGTPSPMIILASMTFAAASHDQTFTDFTAVAGISSLHCLSGGAETFSLVDLAPLADLRALISNTANVMHVSHNYAHLFESANSYSVKHTHGFTEETITLIICKIRPPDTMFKKGLASKTTSVVSPNAYQVQTDDWTRYPDVNDCPRPYHKWKWLPSSDFNPLLLANTATAEEGNNVVAIFTDWFKWVTSGKTVTRVNL